MRKLLAILTAVWFALPVAAQTPAPLPRDLLILISIDGFRSDYLDRGVTPVLAALAAGGATAPMRPSFPSLTFPNHYTIVTGSRPDRHGIVGNTFEDAAIAGGGVFGMANFDAVSDPRAWSQATPLWVTASRAGVRTATMFWPGSEAAIAGVRPDQWAHFDASLAPGHRVDQVLDWLDQPPAKRPGFVTLYFDAVDHAGHEGGPDSPDVAAALAETDRAIGRLVDGLRARGMFERTNLVIVADHGMAATDPARVILLDDFVDVSALRIVTNGPVGGYEPVAGRETDAAKLLGTHPHFACWRRGEVPVRFHYGRNPRVPSLVCLADSGWLIGNRANAARLPVKPGGAHGYDPAGRDMAALFIARGPEFATGVRGPAFDNVDVYPLLARALAVMPEPSDGRLERVGWALAKNTKRPPHWSRDGR